MAIRWRYAEQRQPASVPEADIDARRDLSFWFLAAHRSSLDAKLVKADGPGKTSSSTSPIDN